ncbi:MAG TPA: Rab family GTPase [Chthoniobacterales bacterium]|nr:Rab family GTPase [Chthoniobacterales bacterium]
MIQKKVCLLGTSGVGKTSLVAQFVHSMFSEKYLTTVGVKIDKKTVRVGENEVVLVIWDLAGDDDFQRLQTSYLRGTSGFLLVADGTRAVTLDQALELKERVAASIGAAPFILALNKADLAPQWEVDEARIARLVTDGWQVIKTSAKAGERVEEAFAELARRMTQP